MRYLKIADKVANVTCGRKTLTDKTQVYPESMWPKGHVEDLLRRKFLEVVPGEEKTISSPADAEVSKVAVEVAKVIKQKLTKADFKKNPDLYKQGLRPGDEVEIPNPELETKETEKE